MPWLTSEEFNFIQGGHSNSVASATTYETAGFVNMGQYQSMVACVSKGCMTTAGTANLFMCVASIGAGVATLYGNGSYRYRYATTGGDMTAYATGASTAVAMVTTAGVLYLVEVKGDDMPASTPYVMVCVSTIAQFAPIQIVYVAKPRYPQNAMVTAST
jgi:hypothetical protein